MRATHEVDENQIVRREVKYLNNTLERDQWSIKRTTKPIVNFKSLRASQFILSGIELMLMIRKGQFRIQGDNATSLTDQFCALAGNIPRFEKLMSRRFTSVHQHLKRQNQ